MLNEAHVLVSFTRYTRWLVLQVFNKIELDPSIISSSTENNNFERNICFFSRTKTNKWDIC